jgi:hypothetical protein
MSDRSDEIKRKVPRPPDEDFDTQIHFLHWVIEDTQDTVRFLDTKAAFCVTLLSGMVAVSIDHPVHAPLVHHIVFPIFMVIAACGLLTCLRVIFPTIRPHGSGGPPASPKFFISAARGNQAVRHTLTNPAHNIVSESHVTYVDKVLDSDDHAIINSLAETAVTVSFIRQLKSDRLHTAMYCLVLAILLFAAMALLAA